MLELGILAEKGLELLLPRYSVSTKPFGTVVEAERELASGWKIVFKIGNGIECLLLNDEGKEVRKIKEQCRFKDLDGLEYTLQSLIELMKDTINFEMGY